MSRHRDLARRFLGFSGLQILSALAPLALLPVLARAAGVSGWASLAAGQSVGALVAAFSLYGWAVQGPALVAAASSDERWEIYRSSLVSRGAVLALTLPAGCLASVAIAANGFTILTVLMTCAQAVTALSPMWFGIGVGRPRLVLAYDTIPRLAGVLGTAIAISLGAPLITYPLVLIIASVVGITAFTRRQARTAAYRRRRMGSTLADLRRVLRTQASSAAVQIAGASYGSATVALVGVFATTVATAEFAAGDRFYRFALMAVVAAGNTFQGWVAEAPYPRNRTRMRASLAALTTLGIVGAVAIAFSGSWATAVLFGRDLAIGQSTATWFAVAFFSICVSTSLGRHVLVPLDRARELLVATVTSALVGLPAVAILARTHGAAGGAAGYAASELVGTMVLAGLLLWRPPQAAQSSRGDDTPPVSPA